MNEAHVTKFKRLIAELFMFDQANLDFGIYRIMNTKRAEIKKFLDEELIPQIREELQQLGTSDIADLETQLKKAVAAARDLGVDDPENTGKAKELRAKIEDAKRVVELENEIYDDLYDFFRRYYSSGDYLALRRYKEGVYAIPYEGEEVKLHWANADQYYIKSTEYFRDYTFKLHDGRRVHFKLVEADTEQNNNKPTDDEERCFMLRDGDSIIEQNGELYLCFEYRPDPDKRTQADLNAAAREAVFAAAASEWRFELARHLPTDSDPTRTLLDKYLTDYTARNTFDYFIHKDVGTFLRRELDFYIKTEIMHLDDVENADEKWFSRYRAHVKAFRKVARKIIDFLAQLENFQKKLWLKKKFVIETNYCVTLDRVPEVLYPEIAANHAQRKEWVRLFAIDEIAGDLVTPGYSVPLTVEFLFTNPFLMVDTQFYGDSFKVQLLDSFGNFDEELNGTLINGENFQALGFIENRFRGQIQVVYIDPPYNTDASAIIYKNDYKHSSWLTLIDNRLELTPRLMSENGVLCMAIDDEEAAFAKTVLDKHFSKQIGIACVRSNPQSRKTKGAFSPSHEYALFYGRSENSAPGILEPSDQKLSRYPLTDEHGSYAWLNFIRTGNNDLRVDRPKMYFPIYVDSKDNMRIPNMTWDDNKREYIIQDKPLDTEIAVYPTAEANGTIIEKRWHRGYENVLSQPQEYRVRRSANGKISIDFKTRIDDEATPITWWDNNEYASANYGAAQLKDLFGHKSFDFPKATRLVEDSIKAAGGTAADCVILDYFAGSGTTGHAVINLNRQDNGDGKRKYVLVEMGKYFTSTLKPRIQKAIYSSIWREGKPINRDGASHGFKYLHLESYEDTLNNLRLTPRTDAQQTMLDLNFDLREDYLLHYMLDVESRPSLLNLDRFEEPFEFQMDIGTGTVGETRRVNVDVVETFNYLIGLRVRRMRAFTGVRAVEGELANGQRVLILWRSFKQVDNNALDAFFQHEYYGADPLPFDLVYVNGESFIANLRRDGEVWSVRLIEDDFLRLMFDVQDV